MRMTFLCEIDAHSPLTDSFNSTCSRNPLKFAFFYRIWNFVSFKLFNSQALPYFETILRFKEKQISQ